MKKNRMLSLLAAFAIFISILAPSPVLAEAASQRGSEFQIDGTALVKYQGSDAYVFVPEGVTVIRGGAFAGNKSVVSVYLPDSVKEIGGGAFENCSNLQTIIISGGSKLSTIGAYAFAGCPHLNISFSLSVANVSSKAFPPELISTPTPTPTPKPTPTMKPTPAKPSATGTNPGSGQPGAGSLRITLQPVSVYADEGEIVTFVVMAEGSGTIHYQWVRSNDGVNWVRIENIGGTLSFTATLSLSGYVYKCIVSNGVNTVDSDVVTFIMNAQPAPQVPPQPPEGQISSSVPYVWARQISEHSALISWTEMPSAISYELYRYAVGKGENGGEEFVLLGTFNGTSYTDTNLDFTKYTYTYSLKAVLSFSQNGNPVTTDYSNPAQAEALSAPSSVSAWQETAASVRVSWSPSKYATSYTVKRSINKGEFEVVAQSVTVLQYIDKDLNFLVNTYRYIVVAEMTVPESNEMICVSSDPVEVQDVFSVGREVEINSVVYTITADGAVVTGYRGSASSLTIPSTILNKKYTVVAIGANVFWGNKTLNTITLPKTIRVIESGAFAYCGASIVIK
ncbi:MAG: leucine-rich repeat protein [Clostridia bacterium]|nr:leucine-rich repeat protein [Clostridia bacterium]